MIRAGLMTVLMLVLASPAFAGQSGPVEEWSILFPSFQYFTWEEFNPTGPRLLKEEGLLVGTGGTLRLGLYAKKLTLKLKGEIFGGDVNYIGHTQPNQNSVTSERPVNTDVIYFGTKAESDLGWVFPFSQVSLEPFAGLGYRWWLRLIQDSVAQDANGNPLSVGGATEKWMSLYSRIGARAAWTLSKDCTLLAEGGGKYPFYNENEADQPGGGTVSIKPGREWSAFGEIGVTCKRFRPTIYYEGFRFSQSPTVTVPSSSTQHQMIYQPRSESDIFGINFCWIF
jgi:hypothetical protein